MRRDNATGGAVAGRLSPADIEHIGDEIEHGQGRKARAGAYILNAFRAVMRELYRICRDGASITVTVPHPRHDNFIGDPTHVKAADRAPIDYTEAINGGL
ncbi:MAG: hypothetical protein HQL38_20270, partial [Alphaproteobacteria bacterium]|nr:hypothetical protein [Alphaproteobacteria bacterium]